MLRELDVSNLSPLLDDALAKPAGRVDIRNMLTDYAAENEIPL
jgi:hypothetical protein